MDITNQEISRSRGVTAYGLDGYQQIFSQYNSSFIFASSLIPYEASVNLLSPQAVDSCWTSGNIFLADNGGLVTKRDFNNEIVSSISLSLPKSLSVIQSSVPMVDGNPVDDSCVGLWVISGTSVFRFDSDLNEEYEISSLTDPILVCVNHSNNGCYVIDDTLGLLSFDYNGDLIGSGTFTNDHVLGALTNSEGDLFILVEEELYKFSNADGNINISVTFNLTSYLTSEMAIGSFDIDTSTDYIYTASGDNTTIRVVKFDSLGSHLGSLNTSGDFPYIVKVSQHPSSDSFYMVSDDSKIVFVESSSSESSEMYSDPSSDSSESSFGFSESSSTSSEGFSESSSTSSEGFSESSSTSSEGFSESSSSSEGFSESSSSSFPPFLLKTTSITPTTFDPAITTSSGTATWDLGDTNEVTTNSVSHIYTLSGSKTVNISGLSLSNILVLFVPDDNVSELDVSELTSLTNLTCNTNLISTLDVTANVGLTVLSCVNNSLTELDVSANTSLITFACTNNSLTELDVSANTSLTTLNCSINSLSTLDLSSNTELLNIDADHNSLSESEVDGILSDIVAHGKNFGALDLGFNSVPSASGLIDKATLQAGPRNWTVTTDV